MKKNVRYIVMAYAGEGYEEYILPEIDNSDYKILLKKDVFGLYENLTIFMEIVDGKWSFKADNNYEVLLPDGTDGYDICWKDGMVLSLKLRNRHDIMLVILMNEVIFPVSKKYETRNINQISIGKGEDNSIIYDFRGYISRNHCLLFRHGYQWVVQDNSMNGIYLNGRRASGQTILKFGDCIILFGLRIVFLEDVVAICALSGEFQVKDENLTEWDPHNEWKPEQGVALTDEKVWFKRSPRILEQLYTDKIEIDAPPQLNKTKKRPLLLTVGPSLTMAIPMLMGCLMSILGAKSQGNNAGAYMFTGVITAVSSAAIGVMWALTNIRYADKEEEENEELRYNAYGQYLIEITDFIKRKQEENRQVLFRTYLSGQQCCTFDRFDARLWNHNAKQKDFLTVRIGTGTVPFQAEISAPKEKFTLKKDDLAGKPEMIYEKYKDLRSVPICTDIRKKGMIGVIGGSGKAGAYPVVNNIIAQLAAKHCYTDVKMVFLYNDTPENREQWSFAKWLPHVWLANKKTRLIACDKSEVGDICFEVANVIRRRTEEQNPVEYPLPHFVFFIEDMEILQGELLERFIYEPKPEYGITSVILAERYEDLPNSCENIIQNDGSEAVMFHVVKEEARSRNLIFELVSKEELEQLARRLCDIEVKELEGNGEIPTSLDFMEMYDARTLDELNVLERWKKNRNYENMRVPIGKKADGSLCYLDAHEKYHGPHGLVAGTTGSGKSETLQTWMLSLAVNFSPDDVAFFIIDFKGGGMANLFDGLPHMAGTISNLSGNQVRRSMISIKSEIKRRQKVFADHSVNNINLYTKLYKNHEAKKPMPHLFIIIDEFAELKREEPEFMSELISVAQVGRSLGIHLVLATQKPSGTVDNNIWSNSKFRLCLRVQDKQDSTDMLHKPDAAYITDAGRGYLQVGNDEIYELFQSGYSGANYIADPNLNKSAAAELMTLTGKQIMTGGRVRKKKVSGDEITQLKAVILYLKEVAKQHHYIHKTMLWLPVLSKNIHLTELEEFKKEKFEAGNWPVHKETWKLSAPIGLYDDPEHQEQNTLIVDFSEDGHLAVCGTVATGKSTFLQTLLYSLMNRYNPEELNFYVLDYSSRRLLPFEKAPHCGGVIIDTDVDKVNKFFYMLERMQEERKKLFRGVNYSQYIKSTKATQKLPAIVVVIDHYANFREKTGGQFDDAMLRLSREGVGYGIFLAVSSAGFGASEIPTRMADNIRTVISLEMGDKFKYAEVLRTGRVENLPESDVKGRGLAKVDDRILEFQTALAIDQDTDDFSDEIEVCGEAMSAAWEGNRAKAVPVIPEKPMFKEFRMLEDYQRALADRRYLPIGYLSIDASIYSVDLWKTYCYLIQGRTHSGRKNVLKLLMYAASKKENAEVCVIDLSNSELRQTAEELNVKYLSDVENMFRFFRDTVPLFKERNSKKRELMKLGMEQEELAEQMNREKQMFIFIADIVPFVQKVYQPGTGIGAMNPYLENILEKGMHHGIYFFGVVNPEQVSQITGMQVYRKMISYQCGIHLGGNLSAQRVFQFQNIPYQQQSKTTKPGIGLAADYEEPETANKIVVPLIKGGEILGLSEDSHDEVQNEGGEIS